MFTRATRSLRCERARVYSCRKSAPIFRGFSPCLVSKSYASGTFSRTPRRLKPTLVVAASGTDESVPFRKIQDAAHTRRQEKCRAKARRYNPSSRHSDPAQRARKLLLIGPIVDTIYPSPAHKPLAPLFATPHIITSRAGQSCCLAQGSPSGQGCTDCDLHPSQGACCMCYPRGYG